MIRAAFFGTPHEAIPVLTGLLMIAEVDFVATRPDARRGRSRRLEPPPVKDFAAAHGMEVVQPRRPIELVDRCRHLDVAVVAAYGLLVPGELLTAPGSGFVNLHYSLLPRWRGASPVVRAILAGDDEAGVTLIQMDEGLDTGPILTSAATPIGPEETTGELTDRLAALGGEVVATTLGEVLLGAVEPTPQDEARATHAGKVTVEEAFIAPSRHLAVAVDRAVRAFNPKPGAWGIVDGQRVKVWRARVWAGDGPEPGVAVASAERVLLGCADGTVELNEVQPAGRSAMPAEAWMNGRRGAPARFASSPPAPVADVGELPG